MDDQPKEPQWGLLMQALAARAFRYRAWHDGACVREGVPTVISDLCAPIKITGLGATARGGFSWEALAFVERGEPAGRWECEAALTIAKFGDAIQYKERFIVDFFRLPLPNS